MNHHFEKDCLEILETKVKRGEVSRRQFTQLAALFMGTSALGLKAVFLVTTVIGVTGLWPAILADTGMTTARGLTATVLLASVLLTKRGSGSFIFIWKV